MIQSPTIELTDRFLERYGPPAGGDGPVRIVRELMGATPDRWQEEILRAWAEGERRMSVASCHGPGKTAVAAWLVWCMLLTRCPQRTVATAPGKPQLEGALIPEIKMWGETLPRELQDRFDVKAAGIYLKDKESQSFFEARTSRAENTEALQGVHSDHVLLIVDEASGVPEGVFESAVGSMSYHNATTLLISNPTRTSGFFYETHHGAKDIWRTWTISHTDSPRVTADMVMQVALMYGEESNTYRVRCLGQFPTADDDTLIPWGLISSAQERTLELGSYQTEVWGADIARFGDDSSVLLKRTHRQVLPDIKVWNKSDLMATAGRVKAEYEAAPDKRKPVAIIIDDNGMGAGVVDRLRELGISCVRGVNVGEVAALDPDRFLNARAELWWAVREWLAKKDVMLPKPEKGADFRTDPASMLARELVTPKYGYRSNGKIYLESKEDMKKRGKASPNVADALALTMAEDLSTMIHGKRGGQSWDEPLKRGLLVV